MSKKEHYDYYVVQKDNGFGDDTWTVYSAKTEEECLDFLKTWEYRDNSCQIIGQQFGKEFYNVYDD